MDKTNLTKREYLGPKWVNVWKNIETGVLRYEDTTEEIYNVISKGGDMNLFPFDTETEVRVTSYPLENGVVSEDRDLGSNEYTILPDGRYFVRTLSEGDRFPKDNFYSQEEFHKIYGI